jgi:hypothetical protein
MIGIARPTLRESKVMCKRIGAINCNVKTLESYLRQPTSPQQNGKMLITILEIIIFFKIIVFIFLYYFHMIVSKINFKK